MNTLVKRIELAANLAIIAVALVLSSVLAKHYLSPSPSGDEGVHSRPHIELRAGMSLSVENVDWSKNDKTILLVLSTKCHFCVESAPFYRRISNRLRSSSVRLIGIFPKGQGDGQKYLEDLAISVDDLREVSLDSIKVPVTPALILVDSGGLVTNLWVGKLSTDKESEVLSAVACYECGESN